MFDHKKIEKKWQEEWEKSGLFFASDKSDKPKKFVLIEFPYPSGEGLHMGHLRPFLAGDVYSRYHRMLGFETLYPMGWDAFGLPAENFAIKHKIHPRISTAKNIANAKRQVKSWGIGFDWSREINTTDPEYYRWTQWIFLKFFKAGLAYEATGLINWCPKDKTGLANEEVINGKCDRCGTIVEKKKLRQWYLKITAYAEKLLEGLKTLQWPDAVVQQQENWIGRSEGALIKFPVDKLNTSIEVFTTRPDTLFGATYLVVAPEHPLVNSIVTDDFKLKAEQYIEVAAKKSDIERSALEKEKTGVFTGSYAINPATEEKVPIWIADYVLYGYGTGAIMAVPAHDMRDYEFAKKFELPIKKVIATKSETKNDDEVYAGDGSLINSGEYNFMSSEEARKHITADFGKPKVQYKLRDWVFSRQRYWGEPIPIIHCEKCGIVPVPEDQLPVLLPEVENYEPTGSGESPLAAISDWVNVTCPNCSGAAKRETNTMPQWAGSSWYYLRYADPSNNAEFASKELLKHWQPVDVYFGGMEHTTLHLLYSRFWNLFLYDQGLVTVKEPYTKRIPHGLILAADGEKMSKSRGNVVNPDVLTEQLGADTVRMYELFLGPHESSVSWNDQGIIGVKRFLDRLSKFQENFVSGEDNLNIHKLIKKVSADIENYKFNTAVAAFMEFMNNNPSMSQGNWEDFLKLIAPFVPFTSEELWHQLGKTDSIHSQSWPKYDEGALMETSSVLVVQIMGRTRASFTVPKGLNVQEAKDQALANAVVKKHLEGKEIVKEIYVQDKLINFVVK